MVLNGTFPSARDGNRGVPPGHDSAGGTGPNSIRLIQGMEGVLRSNDAAATEIRAVAKEMRLANDATTRMTSSVERLVAQQTLIMQSLSMPLAQSSGALLNQVSSTHQGHRRGGVVSGSAVLTPGGAPSVVHGGPVGAMGAGVTNATPNITAGVPEARSPQAAQENYAMLQHAHGYSVGQLRQDAGRWIGRTVSSAQIGPSLRPADNPVGWESFNPETNASLGIATHAQVRNMAIANRVRAVGGTVAEQGLGRGLINAIPKGVIGPTAAIVGGVAVADQVAKFAENQRNDNAQYQRILGVSNMGGLAERGHQALYSLSQRGIMSDSQSSALYQGVTGLGLTGGARMDALDLAVQNWKTFGMEVNKSIDFIRINSQAGLKSLTGIADGIASVTSAAKSAGVNGEVATANYTQTFGAASTNMLGEGAAAVASGALSSAFTSLGTGFQNMDASGMFNSNVMSLIGGRQNMTQSQMLAATSGAQGGKTYTQMSQAAVIDKATQMLPQGKQIIASYKRQRNISGTLTPAQANDLAIQVAQMNLVQPRAIVSNMALYGITLQPNQSIAFLLMVLDGTWNPEGQVSAIETSSAQTTLSESARTSTSPNSSTPNLLSVAQSIGADVQTNYDQIPDGKGGYTVKDPTVGGNTSTGWGPFSGSNIKLARNLYLDQVKSGGKDSPIIDKMLKGGNYDQQLLINVGTADKPVMRSMNMYDAIKYHPDQLARGDVQIANGSNQGVSLATSLGLASDPKVAIAYDQKGANAGTAVAAGSTGTAGAGVSGSIGIYPSPELAALLRFQPISGNINITTPPSSIAPSSSYPTGNSSVLTGN